MARRRLSLQPSEPAFRRLPDANEILRRRRLLRWFKWLLPMVALLLLASIAAWPELDRSMNTARLGLRQAGQIRIDSGRMVGARYRGLDGRDRPYTITAADARQRNAPGGGGGGVGGDRIDLRRPVADTLGADGSWIQVDADTGVYLQHEQLLDLHGHVTLYRGDGIMMTGPSADLDLRRGIVASADWVHAEGPFGMLDAQNELLSQHDGIAQFRGPGRLVLNDDRIARPVPAPHGAGNTP